MRNSQATSRNMPTILHTLESNNLAYELKQRPQNGRARSRKISTRDPGNTKIYFTKCPQPAVMTFQYVKPTIAFSVIFDRYTFSILNGIKIK